MSVHTNTTHTTLRTRVNAILRCALALAMCAAIAVTQVAITPVAPAFADEPLQAYADKIDISKATDPAISPSIPAQTYTGEPLTPGFALGLNGVTLVLNQDYTAKYSNNTNAGTATITIEGKGNYTGKRTLSFKINPKNIADGGRIIPVNPVIYSGSAVKPDPDVYMGAKKLVKGKDYTLSYTLEDGVTTITNPTNAGGYNIKISGMGNYQSSILSFFQIAKKNIAGAKVSSIPTQMWTGGPREPRPASVTLDGKTLVYGADYAIVYTNNTDEGTATMKIRGIRNYNGEIGNIHFTIKKMEGEESSSSGSSGSSGGSSSGSASGSTSGTTVMYRMYNPNSGEHFYTASSKERDSLVKSGWRYEGEGWTAPSKSNTPVYRLYSGTDHHYTTSAKERDSLVKSGWKYEGIGWYSDDAKGVPLYRQFNPNVQPTAAFNNSGSHNYTTSKKENDNLVKVGWKAEGIGWYGVDTSKTSTAPPGTVYVTTYGKKYHLATCPTIQGSTLTSMALGTAVAKGYDPCSVCIK